MNKKTIQGVQGVEIQYEDEPSDKMKREWEKQEKVLFEKRRKAKEDKERAEEEAHKRKGRREL